MRDLLNYVIAEGSEEPNNIEQKNEYLRHEQKNMIGNVKINNM
jgi:hypothetical protein